MFQHKWLWRIFVCCQWHAHNYCPYTNGIYEIKAIHRCLRNKYKKFQHHSHPFFSNLLSIRSVGQNVGLQWTVPSELQTIQVVKEVSFTSHWIMDTIRHSILVLFWRTVSSSCGKHNCKHDLYIDFKTTYMFWKIEFTCFTFNHVTINLTSWIP